LLRDNLTLWTSDMQETDKAEALYELSSTTRMYKHKNHGK